MRGSNISRASKYTDFDVIYAQCSGPGGLKLAEFLADRLALRAGQRILDVGCNRGYQSCFLAKEFGVHVVALDPWPDRETGRLTVEHAQDNAIHWGVQDLVLPLNVGVPTTIFAPQSFDAAYSTTALEMVRAFEGEEGYQACLSSIKHALCEDGLFALAEPMHHDVEVPAELEPLIDDEFGWKKCFRTLEDTMASVKAAGFEIIESGYPADAQTWWEEFALHDPFCKLDPEGDPKRLAVDRGRWTTFGYVIARNTAV